jgi:hypothetical protein
MCFELADPVDVSHATTKKCVTKAIVSLLVMLLLQLLQVLMLLLLVPLSVQRSLSVHSGWEFELRWAYYY